ncbi:sigma-70 family RNA polymerase sigma factor [Nocardioides conyzicola]|uniref:SigB/SigF/SigG family RNA polymerase sigma factor n=1 Tax=Nocardioides conyzicola TaxID=1651781 RepID=A0ABP8Y2I0_9ACTN
MNRPPSPRYIARQARNAELVERLADATGRDREAVVEDLVLANLEVARAVARRYGGRSDFLGDLEQVACLALVRAAQDFDPSRGHEFLAYAVTSMTGAMKHFFRDSAWMIRPPRPVQKRHTESREGADHVADGVEVETCFRPWSLDAPTPGEGAPLGETLPAGWDGTWEESEARLMLWPHLRALPPRARHLLHRRFVDDCTQQEIADELGVSQMHVSRLLNRYVGELRDRMTAAA